MSRSLKKGPFVQEKLLKEVEAMKAANDKKAEEIMKSLANVKNIAAAKKVKGAKATDVAQATFASPVFVQATGAAEPALSGAIAATKQGQYCARPVKGYRGVYVFQVTKKAKRAGLLHDIGKVPDEDPEMPHALYGAKLAEQCKEKPDICNAIGAHHDECEMQSLIAPIVQIWLF